MNTEKTIKTIDKVMLLKKRERWKGCCEIFCKGEHQETCKYCKYLQDESLLETQGW